MKPKRLLVFSLAIGFALSSLLTMALVRHYSATTINPPPPAGRNHRVRIVALSPLPAAAIKARTSTTDEEHALLTAVYEAARIQPVEALTLAMENAPANLAGDNLIAHAAAQWAATDPRATAAWAEQITDEVLRGRILSVVATIWGESDAGAAAELALQTLPTGRMQDDAIIGIVQRWVQKQPADAAAWVLEFPEGQLRVTALENLLKIWSTQDAAQTTQWLNTLAAGTNRDMAVVAYVTTIAATSPALAARWAESISDESLRSHELAALAASSVASAN